MQRQLAASNEWLKLGVGKLKCKKVKTIVQIEKKNCFSTVFTDGKVICLFITVITSCPVLFTWYLDGLH